MATNRFTTRRTRTDSISSRKAQVIKPVSLGEQLQKILRHPTVILVCVAIGAVLGIGTSLVASHSYESSSSVMVYTLTQDPNAQASNQQTVNIDTEASVAGSLQVAELAASKIDANDPDLADKIKNSVEVAAHSGTSILDFTATADSAENAATYANATAEAYLEVRQQSLQSQIDSSVQLIQDSISKLGENDSATRTALQEKLAQVEATSTTPGRITSTAQTPQSSSNLALWKYLLVGAVAGALIGAFAARIVDSRSSRLGYADRVQNITGTPALQIRANYQREDTRRALRSIGLTEAQIAESGLGGLVIYSDSQKAAEQIFKYVAEATADILIPSPSGKNEAESPEIVLLDSNSQISDVLNTADLLGAGLVVVTAETSFAHLKEFSAVAESSDALIEYAYLSR